MFDQHVVIIKHQVKAAVFLCVFWSEAFIIYWTLL